MFSARHTSLAVSKEQQVTYGGLSNTLILFYCCRTHLTAWLWLPTLARLSCRCRTTPSLLPSRSASSAALTCTPPTRKELPTPVSKCKWTLCKSTVCALLIHVFWVLGYCTLVASMESTCQRPSGGRWTRSFGNNLSTTTRRRRTWPSRASTLPSGIRTRANQMSTWVSTQ